MKKYKKHSVLIVDDAQRARKLLRLMIMDCLPWVEICGEAADAEEAWTLIQSLQPDIVLLDIEMPGRTGLDLAEQLLELSQVPQVIFTTAYQEYAIQAFRLSAIDYLLKPIDENLLVEAMQRAVQQKELREAGVRLKLLKQNFEEKERQMLCLPVRSGYEYVPVKSVHYVEADGSYVRVHTEVGCKVISKNLKYFENALEHLPQFIRVHRSVLINLEAMKAFEKSDRGHILMQDGTELPLSRSRRATFIARLEQYR